MENIFDLGEQLCPDLEYDAMFVGVSGLPRVRLGSAIIIDTGEGFDFEIPLHNNGLLLEGHIGSTYNFIHMIDPKTGYIHQLFHAEFRPLSADTRDFKVVLFDEAPCAFGTKTQEIRIGELVFENKRERPFIPREEEFGVAVNF